MKCEIIFKYFTCLTKLFYFDIKRDGSGMFTMHSERKRSVLLSYSRKHEEGEPKNDDKPHKCNICERAFAFKASLKTHLLKHAPKVPYDCLVCGRVFGMRDDFIDHMKIHDHENTVEVSHSVDPFGYSSAESEASTLVAHAETSTDAGVSERSENCDIEFELKEKNCVVEDRVSEDEKDVIDKSFVLVIDIPKGDGSPSSNLSSQRHIEPPSALTSGSGNSVCCPECKEFFPSEDLLEKHTVTDSHQCKECERFYSSCQNLKLHRQSHIVVVKCKTCGKEFSSRKSLKRHGLSHAKEQKCSLCEQICTNKISLRLHMNKVHQESKYIKCKECDQKIKRCDLSKHKMIHKGSESYQCEECGICFTELYKLKNHLKFHEHGNIDWKCKICGKILLTRPGLKGHMLTHTGEQECSICKLKLSSASSLKFHILRVHEGKSSRKERRVQCDVCGNMYGRSYIGTHLKVHSGQKDLSCSVCSKHFLSQANLREHMITHKPGRRHSCSTCEKVFATNKSLVIHTRKHTGETPYKCSVCTKTFVTSWTLKNHLRLHDVEEAFSCKICDKKFSQKKSLYAHYAGTAHSKEEQQQLDPKILNSLCTKYMCSECGKNCYEKTMLTYHMRTHTKEKPYKCTECDKAFSVKSALKSHMKFHTGDLQFECSICKKPFAHKSQAVKHELLHKGEKPHLCTLCGKAFFTKNNLKIHMERHSRKTLYVCSTCSLEFSTKKKYMSHQKSCQSGALSNIQISETGSLDGSSILDLYGSVNDIHIRESELKKGVREPDGSDSFGEGQPSIECSEYLFDFDVESSQRVTFSLSEDVNCIKEELVVLEIDPLELDQEKII